MTASAVRAATDASRAHLTARLEVLETQVAQAVQRRRSRWSGAPDGRLAGMALSEVEIDALLSASVATAVTAPPPVDDLLLRVEAAVDEAETGGDPTRLRRLQRRFGLGALDIGLLLVALAPDLDARFERFYAYLHDDVTRRRPSIGLALELVGAEPLDQTTRAVLRPSGRLVGYGLVAVDDADRPFLSRTLRVPDRVAAYLLGNDEPDPAVEPHLGITVAWRGTGHDRLVAALRSGTRCFYAHERPGGCGASAFAAALAEFGLRTVEVDLRPDAARRAIAGAVPDGSAAGQTPIDLVPAVLREVGLTGAGLVVNHADELARHHPSMVRRLAESAAVVCFAGRAGWDPEWARVLPLVFDVPALPTGARAALWSVVLGPEPAASKVDVTATLSTLRLRPSQMVTVADWARRRAASQKRDLTIADLTDGARQLNTATLAGLSTRVTPRARWNDLVLASPVQRAVRKVAERARHRELVHGVWGVGATARRSGTVALFSGPSGAGKTLAAEVVAGELGVDLYVVNLATVVDTSPGETELNLERIFHAAEEVNGLLLFAEPQVLLGKRTDAHDGQGRHRDVEAARLLQWLDRFDGVAVLAADTGADLDEAVVRRVDLTVEFGLPDAEQRRAIWRTCLPTGLPLAADVDLEFLAESFPLAGGQIRSICVEAAYLAAAGGTSVGMEHLIRATALEHRKVGRPLTETEFKQHHDLALREVAT